MKDLRRRPKCSRSFTCQLSFVSTIQQDDFGRLYRFTLSLFDWVDTSLTNQQIANPERKIVGNLTFVSMEKLETTAGARKVVNDLV